MEYFTFKQHLLALIVLGISITLPTTLTIAEPNPYESEISRLSEHAMEQLPSNTLKHSALLNEFILNQDVNRGSRIKRGVISRPNRVKTLLSQNATLEFLNSITNDVQRQYVAQHLSTCPFIRLCNYSLDVRMPGVSRDPEGKMTCCSYCYCSASCLDSKNCCPDIGLQTRKTSNNDIVDGTATDEEVSIKDEDVSAICSVPILVKTPRMIANQGYMIVNDCPPYASIALKEKCSLEYAVGDLKLHDVTPVYDVRSNLTYRNRYCAACNNITNSNLTEWMPIVKCLDKAESFVSENVMINAMISKSSCNLHFEPIESTIEAVACMYIVSECNETGAWETFDDIVEQGCREYELKFYFNQTYYKNIMCAVCNGLDTNRHLPDGSSCTPPSSQDMGGSDQPSFIGLLVRDLHQQDGPTTRSRGFCPDGYLYDTMAKSCRQLYCSDLHYLVNNECIRTYDMVRTIAMCVSYEYIPVRPLSLETTIRALNSLNSMLYSLDLELRINNIIKICKVKLFIQTGLRYTESQLDELKQLGVHNVTGIKADIVLANAKTYGGGDTYFKPEDIMVKLLSFNNSIPYYEEPRKPSSFSIQPSTCWQDAPSRALRSLTRIPPVADIVKYAFADADGMLAVPYFDANKAQNQRCPSFAYVQPYNSFLSCPMVNINKSEFPGVVRTNSLWSADKNVSVKFGQYYTDPVNQSAMFICSDVYMTLIPAVSSADGSRLMDLPCLGISLATLLLQTYLMV